MQFCLLILISKFNLITLNRDYIKRALKGLQAAPVGRDGLGDPVGVCGNPVINFTKNFF